MVRDSYPKVSLQERNQPVGVSFFIFRLGVLSVCSLNKSVCKHFLAP